MFTFLVFYLIIGGVFGIAFCLISMYRDAVEELAGQKLPSQEWLLTFSVVVVPGWIFLFLFSLYLRYYTDEFEK